MDKAPFRHPILVVEDDSAVADDLTLLLGEWFDISTASNARQGLRRLQETAYHALVLDLDLPASLAGGGPLEGFTLATWTRSEFKNSVPIVVFTREVPDHLTGRLESLVDAIFLKSSPISELEACLLQLISKRQEK